MDQQMLNYSRIETAIAFISANFKNQPSLDEIAAHVNLSPAHFQRIFTDWAGTSPKKFLQFISLGHAKDLLRQKNATLFDAAFETGLSSTSRLHELFVSIEGMTPAEFRNAGRSLEIRYWFYPTLFGKVIVASTGKGICHLAFGEDDHLAVEKLVQRFPQAELKREKADLHEAALSIFAAERPICLR